MLICKYSGWGQLENAAVAGRGREAGSVEISVAANREPREAATPSRGKVENDAFRSGRRNLIYRAAAGPTGHPNPVHIAVTALYDVVFGLAGVNRTQWERVQCGWSLGVRRNGRPGEYDNGPEP